VPQMKYEKHNARQYEQILRAARQLFVEKGIERVSSGGQLRYRARDALQIFPR